MSEGQAPGRRPDSLESPLRLFVESPERERTEDAGRQVPLFTAYVEAPGEKLHHDGSFGAYMDLKKRKLDEQFAKGTVGTLPTVDELFKGVSIHVNGLTEPSHAELRRLMHMHGGSFKNYYSRSTVTHIICSNLPDAKIKAFEKEKNPTPFVRPEWVTESIEAGRLLPIGPYVLERTRAGGPGQTTLVFAKGGPPSSTTLRKERLAQAQAVAKRMRDACQLLRGPPKSSRDDPNFVESFYRASRLHFIGTWKTRLEKLMQSEDAERSPAPTPASASQERIVVHVDMDCFFASVAEASHPEFHGLPLAVCHSNAKGSGEISSANYEARKSGIHASMFMARAKELCPDLIVVPYEFEKYEAVSEAVFRIFLRYTSAVQAISCDEAFLDVTGLGDPSDLVARMRQDIQSETACRASAGIGSNMLLARLATAKAKPDGQYHLKVENALTELASLDVQDLPGIGWRTGEKLREAGFHKVLDIQKSSRAALQKIMGDKAGSLAFDHAFGHDKRVVTPSRGGTERKSVGAEVNWGVRFDSDVDAENFLMSIAQQVGERLARLGMCGGSVTLKIKKRREGAQEPRKFLGMGICDSLTRSVAVNQVQSASKIFEHALPLLRSLRVPFADVRGVGLSVTKLERAGAVGRVETGPCLGGGFSPQAARRNVLHEKKTGGIEAFAKPLARSNQESEQARRKAQAPYQIHPDAIDESVLAELPSDLQQEIRREYGLAQGRDGASDLDKGSAMPGIAPVFAQNKRKTNQRAQSVLKSNTKIAQGRSDRGGTSTATKPRPLLTEFDPMRMSQVDVDVLRELPAALQEEVAKSLNQYGRGFKRKKISDALLPKVDASAQARKAHRQASRDHSRTVHALLTDLDPLLQEAALSLHVGSSTGFISQLETWLQECTATNAQAKESGTDATHVRDEVCRLAELVVAELESPASRIGQVAGWSLVRGLIRLDEAYGRAGWGTAHLSAAAAEILGRRHGILP